MRGRERTIRRAGAGVDCAGGMGTLNPRYMAWPRPGMRIHRAGRGRGWQRAGRGAPGVRFAD
jgi:hypothetical protein